MQLCRLTSLAGLVAVLWGCTDQPVPTETAGPLFSLTATTAVTVIGTGTDPTDELNVQQAVDNYDTVTLVGSFDFGALGSVAITNPGVTVQGHESGATIHGGWFPLTATGDNVTIRGLMFDGGGVPIQVSDANGPGNVTTIEGNTMSSASECVRVFGTSGTIRIVGNECASDWGYWPLMRIYGNGGGPDDLLEVRDNTISGSRFGIHSDYNNCTVRITDNEITLHQYYDLASRAIFVGAWSVAPWEDYDNPPVLVKGNHINMQLTDGWGTGISAGHSLRGINNVTIEANTLIGTSGAGITKFPYGRNTRIVGNDLSGLTTWDSQIYVFAGHTLVADNVLGPVGPLTPWYSTGILLLSVNHHPNWYPPSPMPAITENVVLMGNDYRLTGLPGWPSGNGAILIESEADVGWFGTEVAHNLIDETGRFPVGSGWPGRQIFERQSDLVYDNRIVGLRADHVHDPGIGQRIKEARAQMLELMQSLDAQDDFRERPVGGGTE